MLVMVPEAEGGKFLKKILKKLKGLGGGGGKGGGRGKGGGGGGGGWGR